MKHKFEALQRGLFIMGLMEGMRGWRTVEEVRQQYAESIDGENVPVMKTFYRYLVFLSELGVLDCRDAVTPLNNLRLEFRWKRHLPPIE